MRLLWIVVFSRFHIASLLGEAVDRTRKRERHRAEVGLRRTIHRTRCHWLRDAIHRH
ncbi:transposase [Burkholderia cenocepacia]|uniref:transposase n=1 Tax=Burkholderia cenocepacia TaxID=95486 RepID=UPI0039080921